MDMIVTHKPSDLSPWAMCIMYWAYSTETRCKNACFIGEGGWVYSTVLMWEICPHRFSRTLRFVSTPLKSFLEGKRKVKWSGMTNSPRITEHCVSLFFSLLICFTSKVQFFCSRSALSVFLRVAVTSGSAGVEGSWRKSGACHYLTCYSGLQHYIPLNPFCASSHQWPPT